MPEPGTLGDRVIALSEVDSTNAEAMRRVAAGERGPLWIVAERQLAGRGRSGRAWSTPAGNLAATLLFMPGCAPERLHELSLLTGIAVHDAVLPMYRRAKAPGPGAPRLKWPNDILAGDAKIGGILIESTTFAGALMVAIGIGLNIAHAPRIEGRATAAIGDWQVQVSPSELLQSIREQMSRWLEAWQGGQRFDVIRAAWLARGTPVGSAITVNAGAPIAGTFAGLDSDGALLLVDGVGSTRRFTFGDVTLAPPKA